MRYKIAVGSTDYVNVTEHFGGCRQFLIYETEQEKEEYRIVEERKTVYTLSCGGHQGDKILEKIHALRDCQIVLVKQLGGQSEKLLIHNRIIALQYQGTIESAFYKIKKFYDKQIFTTSIKSPIC